MSTQMDTTYQYIKERILNGVFRPSQKLTEVELAQQIGVSRNTIKKAFLKLEQENLVVVETNKGVTIKAFTLEEILNYLEIREVLEILVSRSAVQNIDSDTLENMNNILQQMRGFLEHNEFDKYSEKNKEFHMLIYSSSSNRPAVDMIKIIRTQLLRYQLRTILVPGRNKASLQEHTDIYEAFCQRNAEQVSQAISNHVSAVRKVIKDNYLFLS